MLGFLLCSATGSRSRRLVLARRSATFWVRRLVPKAGELSYLDVWQLSLFGDWFTESSTCPLRTFGNFLGSATCLRSRRLVLSGRLATFWVRRLVHEVGDSSFPDVWQLSLFGDWFTESATRAFLDVWQLLDSVTDSLIYVDAIFAPTLLNILFSKSYSSVLPSALTTLSLLP